MPASATKRRKPKTMLESDYVAGLEAELVAAKKELRSTQLKLERMTRAAAAAQIGLGGMAGELEEIAKAPKVQDVQRAAKALRDILAISVKAETTRG